MDSLAMLIGGGVFGGLCGTVGGYLMFIYPRRVRARLVKEISQPWPLPRFAYMESIAAAGGSRWHIRELPPGTPLKLSGGITSASLCGRVKRGWDLRTGVSPRYNEYTCPECLKAYVLTEEV